MCHGHQHAPIFTSQTLLTAAEMSTATGWQMSRPPMEHLCRVGGVKLSLVCNNSVVSAVHITYKQLEILNIYL